MGVIGIVLLLVSYIAYLGSEKTFLLLDITATFFLLIYSIQIRDFVFVFVNSFIILMLTIKYIQKYGRITSEQILQQGEGSGSNEDAPRSDRLRRRAHGPLE